MCGIVGFAGKREAAPVLLAGLAKLEYRGYDSAGLAISNGKDITIEKAKGRLKNLVEKVDDGKAIKGHIGVGHTRWATHGEPSDENSHPHTSHLEKVAVVHNGIIENYMEIKEKLISKGCKFTSDTDTEVVAHLLDYYYQNSEFAGNPLACVTKMMTRVEGTYAFGIIFSDVPDKLFAVRKDSPLIVGLAKDSNLIASDIPAILEHTRDVYLLSDKEIAVLTSDSVELYNIDLEPVQKEIYHVEWDAKAAEKGGYEHFMFKEIMEQPHAIKETISPRIKGDEIVLDDFKLTAEEIAQIDKVYIVACGSAYHVGAVAKYIIEKKAKISVEVDLASEFRYRSPLVTDKTLVIVISQSGETLDTLCALREAKRLGARILSIVNVVGSSIARESDDLLYTWAGPEIAVATTKAYSTQLAVVYLLAEYLRKAKFGGKSADFIKELDKIPKDIEKIIENQTENLQHYASMFAGSKDVFFLGRGIDYAIALEGSLKLKEISYIHSEAYAAGELKHGTISLIEKGTMVFALATQDELFDKIMSNIREVKARGAVVMALVCESRKKDAEKFADHVITIPDVANELAPSLAVIPLQLFSYYMAVQRGCDVDKPRNLAKSVTVE